MDKIISIINEEILSFSNTSFIGEEYSSDGNLYGYHATSSDKLESIKDNGFNIGQRSMQGKGFYGFYDLSHAQRYANKGEINNPVLIKFMITCKGCLLYLNMDIAKQVLGRNYHLTNQVEQYFKYYSDTRNGLDFLLKEANAVYKKDMTMDELIQELNYIENNNSEGNQRTFVFNLISSNTNNKLNICWNGNYGLEYRINNMNIIEPLGYMDISSESEFHEFETLDLIPDTDEYKPLVDFITNNYNINPNRIIKTELIKIKYQINNALNTVRNNRDYDYYWDILKLIDNLI